MVDYNGEYTTGTFQGVPVPMFKHHDIFRYCYRVNGEWIYKSDVEVISAVCTSPHMGGNSTDNLWGTSAEPIKVEWMDENNVKNPDMVNHPPHYNAHPSGIEVIRITEHMNFCLGNAVKYIMRADHKDDSLTDLRKAAWYINREIERLTREDAP